LELVYLSKILFTLPWRNNHYWYSSNF